jgi:hypothetical protein
VASSREREDAQGRLDDDGRDGRQPYESPAVISEDVFETLALSCGKAHREACKDISVRS